MLRRRDHAFASRNIWGNFAPDMTANTNISSLHSAQRELITGSIAIAAIVLFIWTGGSAMTAVVRYMTGVGPGVEQILLIAVLLNIALILFGWRRYRDLEIEVQLRREAEEQARALAEVDPLTGCLNRRSFAEKGTQLLEQTQAGGQSIALLMLDLDNFKQVNDVYGHAAGDQVLVKAAERIRALVPAGALTARLGGDEFACAFIFDLNSPETVDRVAEDLVAAMTDPVRENGLHLRISTSIGVAHSDPESESIDMLMRRADIAMYCAKRQGRNCYAWFDSAIEREFSVRDRMEEEIRQGIPKGEFLPYYEARMDLVSGELLGFEILARWKHRAQGLLTPDMFLPVAENGNLVGALSLAVMRQAFEEARDWESALPLSVNISPRQLRDPWMSQKLQKLLVETGFPASRLEVELTEAALFEDLALAKEVVESLKNQGIRITLDNFGTGFSALAHVRALPFDSIKISRNLVGAVNRNDDSASVVGTIIQLGKSLGLPVVAVGIEDRMIRDRLLELGCTQGQGWHLGKPVASDQARIMLNERRPAAAKAEPRASRTGLPGRKAI